MVLEEEIVKEARSWIGTKFRYQGRVKKNKFNNGGVDCLGLIIGVLDAVGFNYNGKPLSFYDDICYSTRPNYDLLKSRFSTYFKEIDSKNIKIGDIVLKKVSPTQYHLMIYTGETFIHASAITHCVVEHIVDNFNDCVVYSVK